jgi:MFS family permease
MHHIDDPSASGIGSEGKSGPLENRPWYTLLSGYHWFVLAVCALGWLFDCLDQQLFILARPQAMEDLLTYMKDSPDFKFWKDTFGDISTSVFIAGWATGGLVFGMLGDRIGRSKTMMLTILIYSACTGLSALSLTVYDFAFYRFLTGLGVGGEFAVGVALVAEVMPSKARTQALGLLQALSAFGNISAALINLQLALTEQSELPMTRWRLMFVIGALPALLALLVRGWLKEPEKWVQAKAEGKATIQLGSYAELFGDPVWRKHAILGLLLACSGVIGLWAVGFYTPDLIRDVNKIPATSQAFARLTKEASEKGDTKRAASLEEMRALLEKDPKATVSKSLVALKAEVDAVVTKQLTIYQSLTSIMLNLGAFLGIFGFSSLAQRIGRKPTFAIALLAAFFSTIYVFYSLQHFWQIFVLVPVMGFCQLSLFGGYAIYFPELFPTRLRSTGTSFCYNVGRFVAAFGPLVKIGLNYAFSGYGDNSLRYGGMTMCVVFLIGLFVLPFLPETKGKPLPE